MNTHAAEIRLIIGTYTGNGASDIPFPSKGIYSLTYNCDTQTASIPVLEIASENPSFMALDALYARLYAVKEAAEGLVTAYVRKAEEGGWMDVASQPSEGAYPCYTSLSPDSHTLAVANYGSGTVALYDVHPDTGAIDSPFHIIAHHGSGPNTSRQEGPHAHWVNWSADGQYLYVVDLGIDKVMVYDRSDNWTHGRDALKLNPGSGPRHMAFHPSAATAYILNELSNSIVAARVGDCGLLEPFQELSTLPDGFSGKSQAAHIALTLDGQFLYTSNRGDDSIAVFSVGAKGALERRQIISCGGSWPRSFTLVPWMNMLFVANRYSHSISVFRIESDGTLHQKSEIKGIPQPVFIQALPL
ncbi:MAG: lactonase family protein [Opitutales bacterium]|nr:lactonase family protein [Opitutales bacterium]